MKAYFSHLWIFVLITAPVVAAPSDVSHPFMLWTPKEASAIRKTVETESWAQRQYEEMLQWKTGTTFAKLFQYAVMGDREVGEREKDYLLKIVGTHPRQYEKLEHGGRHYDCYLDALRYDVLYNILTPSERRKVEETFRDYIAYQLTDKKVYNKLSWLPNMQWPRPMAAHLMAVALRDERSISALFNGNGGWKQYFDHNVLDGSFYIEEFAKYYSMTGEMLLWCRGLERLGLDGMGFGYTGRGGATMESYLQSMIRVAYPRVEIPGGRPHHGIVTMGDAKGYKFDKKSGVPRVFQHSIVTGHLADGTGGNVLFSRNNMNGRDHRHAKVPKMRAPLWFEIGHARWPGRGYDYFLAQMRKSGEDRYLPTLLWGLAPIDPAKATPPPAPSLAADERGFALLRANQTPAYWESPDPVVALQFATLYVHYVADCFSLLGYHAYNRPIYLNRPISRGYNGGPYDFHVRAHCGVVVDGLQAEPIGRIPQQHDFSGGLAQYTAIRSETPEVPYTGKELRSSDDPKRGATRIYPGVEMTRSLVLTREYLCDVFHLSSDQPRQYHWLVHALGEARPEQPNKWKESSALQKSLFNTPEIWISDARMMSVEGDWSLSTLQTCSLDDPSESRLGKAWYDRKVGVRVSMLGEPGTTAWHFTPPRNYTPGSPRGPKKGESMERHDEAGAVSIAVARKAPTTTFVALHEPFENGKHGIETFTRFARDDRAVGAIIRGRGIDDRVLVRFDHQPDQPATLSASNGESFTFTGYALVRIRKARVEVSGNLTGMKLKVAGKPELILNGEEVPAVVREGMLILSK